jgi:prolyl oligopeptidase PreP (S9A serine peptidase family)
MVVENESQSREIGEKLTEENETLNKKVAIDMMHNMADATEKEEEEREEELVDFEDSQDKLGDQEEEEEDVFESQESFTTKVNKITAISKTNEELIAVKLEHEKAKRKVTLEEPRRCSRLKE